LIEVMERAAGRAFHNQRFERPQGADFGPGGVAKGELP
jgi:hypothetical protein